MYLLRLSVQQQFGLCKFHSRFPNPSVRISLALLRDCPGTSLRPEGTEIFILRSDESSGFLV